MSLEQIGEFGFIKKISRGCLIRPQSVLKAIGDDAAAFISNREEVTLLTTDMLVERVHFLRNTTSGFNLGYKALAINLSDIAAMGGTAREAFISIGIPNDCPIVYLEDLYRGIKTLAAEFGVNILGGDTTRSKTDLIINICLTGSVPEKEILYRNAARQGDIIVSTGFLGDSRAGLYLIANGIETDTEESKYLFNAHILPKSYLREGRFLACLDGVHAAIDVSDGLSSDIGHIANESKVGIRLFAEKIPVSKNLISFCDRFGFDPVGFALAGGEDYTLIFTVAPQKMETIIENYSKTFKQPLFPIGETTVPGRMELIDPGGRVKNLSPSGWDHFKLR